MANISDAYGTISLKGTWTDAMCSNLNVVADYWRGWYYNICVDGKFNTNVLELPFYGSGRWTFKSNLKSLSNWIANDFEDRAKDGAVKVAYGLLMADMQMYGSSIEFAYSDHEPGFEILYDGTAVFKANGGALIMDNAAETYLEYCQANLFERGFGSEDDEDAE